MKKITNYSREICILIVVCCATENCMYEWNSNVCVARISTIRPSLITLPLVFFFILLETTPRSLYRALLLLGLNELNSLSEFNFLQFSTQFSVSLNNEGTKIKWCLIFLNREQFEYYSKQCLLNKTAMTTRNMQANSILKLRENFVNEQNQIFQK